MKFAKFCLICGKQTGAPYDHKKCSKKLQKLMHGSNERKNSNKTLNNTNASKKNVRDFTDFIVSTESFNEI